MNGDSFFPVFASFWIQSTLSCLPLFAVVLVFSLCHVEVTHLLLTVPAKLTTSHWVKVSDVRLDETSTVAESLLQVSLRSLGNLTGDSWNHQINQVLSVVFLPFNCRWLWSFRSSVSSQNCTCSTIFGKYVKKNSEEFTFYYTNEADEGIWKYNLDD